MKMLLCLLLTGIFLTSCSPYGNITSRTDPSANFASYQTYQFMDEDLTSPVSNATREVNAVKQAVAQELNERGYRRTAANPDLSVNIGMVISEKTQTRETDIREAPRYIGQRRYAWKSETVKVGTYDEGMLQVEIVDPRQNKLVWEATGSTVLKKNRDNDTFDRAISRMFKSFPKKTAK